MSLWWEMEHVVVKDPTQRCVLHQVHHMETLTTVCHGQLLWRSQLPLGCRERKTWLVGKSLNQH